VVGAVGSVGVPAVASPGLAVVSPAFGYAELGEVPVELRGVVVSPAFGVVDPGGVSMGGVAEVEGEVELPVVDGGAVDEGAVCWAITVPANIAEQTIVARRADFREKHFMRCLAWGKIPRRFGWQKLGHWVPSISFLGAMESNRNRMM